jgi:membrane protease YdiL (CAAX protease family)
MSAKQPARINLIAVIVATIAALIFRAWLQIELLDKGYTQDFAADLSYLVVPPILLLLLLPIWQQQGGFIATLFTRQALSLGLLARAFAIGCLLRLAAWCELVAGVSLGWYRNADATAVVGPTFAFECPAPQALILGFVVMAMLVPFIEETIHRGLVQTRLYERGALFAISVSALIFMLAHRPSTWAFVFVAGVVFGIQYWQTKTLWSSVVTHATINGLILLDWRCLRGQWNPPASDVPLWTAGIVSLCLLLLALLSIGLLLRKRPRGTPVPRV